MDILNTDFPAYHARLRPKACALIDGTGTALHYAAFDARIGAVAAGLRDYFGIQEGDRVALLACNAAETFVLQFACQRIGAILVPLHLRGTENDLRYALGLVTPSVLLHDTMHADRAYAAAGGAIPTAPLVVPHGADPVAGGLLAADATSLLLFTSGTTGQPKAVRVTNRMMAFNAQNMAIAADIQSDALHPVILPLYHAAGFNLYANPVFLRGGAVEVPADISSDLIFDLVERTTRPATHLFAVPTLFKSLADHPRFRTANLSALRVAGVGGDTVSREVLEVWAARGVRLRHGYGMTEAGPAILAQDAQSAIDEPESVGYPLLNIQVRLRGDADADETVVCGELQVRGPTVMPGYWNDSGATADAFDEGWLRTGDIARVGEAGRYRIVGRIKEIIISGGENVHPAEIELVLAEHPDVEEVAAFGMPDDHWGQVCWVAIRAQGLVKSDELIRHCECRLPRFKLPRRIVFLDSFPRNALGKIDRPALRATVAAQE